MNANRSDCNKKLFYIVSFVSIVLLAILAYLVWLLDTKWYNFVGFIVCCMVVLCLLIISLVSKKQSICRFALLLDISFVFLGLIYYFVLRYDLLRIFFDQKLLEEFLSKYGNVSAIVFVVIQFLQVTIIPIPSAITTLAGVALFGVWKSFALSNIGVISGSMFAFFLGRKLGSKLFIWIGGQESFERYLQIVKGRDKFMLFIMFLLPFFPDDLLCIMAGVTTMTYGGFFSMMMLVRPISILALSGVFKGLVSIPFTSGGIVVWIGVIVAVIILFVLSWRYGEKFENWLLKCSERVKNKLLLRDNSKKVDRIFYSKNIKKNNKFRIRQKK